MRDENKKKQLEREELELAEMAKEEEKWKKERIDAGNLFTGYDKVSTKSKMKLLLDMWYNTKDPDKKLIIDDLMRDVEKTKLGITLNYHYVDEKLDKSDTVFVEQKKLGVKPKNDDPNHLIIEGDNMHSLTALKNTKQEVDVVYIDPPYNTGKEFAYNDKLVSGDDQQKHSKWLSFMKQRLELAKDIMSEEGIIFLSIDDNEHAYLKVLMDEVFGEENFMYNFCVKMKDGGVSGAQITNSHEHTLMYTKNNKIRLNEEACQIKIELEDWNKNNKVVYFGLTNEKYLQMKEVDIKENGAFDTRIGNLEFIEKIGTELCKKHLQKYKYIFRFTNPQSTRSQRIIKDLPNNQFISWKVDSRKNKGSKTTYFGKYNGASSPLIFDAEGYILQKMSTIWTDISTAGLANEGWVSFKNGKKPIKLIKRLIDLHPNKNATVLDFFAGSGTTGQAVMEVNQEDGGNRRFILCTNNERTGFDTINHPEQGIARAICRERIYRVINGVGSKGETFPWTYNNKIKSLKNNNVRYLKTELVNKRRELEEQTKKGLTPALFFTKEQRNLYKQEFDTDSIEVLTDFKKRKKIKKHSMDR